MSTMTSKEYFSQKMALLKECLTITEEFMSRMEEWEELEQILNRREEVIRQIQQLEEAVDQAVIQSCTEEEKAEMNRMLSLILGLDQDAVKTLRQDQKDTMGVIKANVQGQKIAGYASEAGQRGRFLDFKE